MPEDTYAQQRQQICAILRFVRSMNIKTLYMVSELIATGKRTKRLRRVDLWRFFVERRKGQRYRKEFRQQAVERMSACGNVVALAGDLGIARRVLYNWRDQVEENESAARANSRSGAA